MDAFQRITQSATESVSWDWEAIRKTVGSIQPPEGTVNPRDIFAAPYFPVPFSERFVLSSDTTQEEEIEQDDALDIDECAAVTKDREAIEAYKTILTHDYRYLKNNQTSNDMLNVLNRLYKSEDVQEKVNIQTAIKELTQNWMEDNPLAKKPEGTFYGIFFLERKSSPFFVKGAAVATAKIYAQTAIDHFAANPNLKNAQALFTLWAKLFHAYQYSYYLNGNGLGLTTHELITFALHEVIEEMDIAAIENKLTEVDAMLFKAWVQEYSFKTVHSKESAPMSLTWLASVTTGAACQCTRSAKRGYFFLEFTGEAKVPQCERYSLPFNPADTCEILNNAQATTLANPGKRTTRSAQLPEPPGRSKRARK